MQKSIDQYYILYVLDFPTNVPYFDQSGCGPLYRLRDRDLNMNPVKGRKNFFPSNNTNWVSLTIGDVLYLRKRAQYNWPF